MKIMTRQHYAKDWTAKNAERYDDPFSPIGFGDTEIEAVEDLRNKIATGFGYASRMAALEMTGKSTIN
jgi:hypothetical protein